MTEFDIDNPPDDSEDTPAARRRRERRSRKETTTKSEKDKPAGPSESQVQGRLNEAFSKLASQLHSKGDEELATAIEEERQGMTRGLISLTSSVTFLRSPLVFIIELGLVLLAFWRVGRILLGRLFVWWGGYQQQQQQQEEPVMPQGSPIIPADSIMAN